MMTSLGLLDPPCTAAFTPTYAQVHQLPYSVTGAYLRTVSASSISTKKSLAAAVILESCLLVPPLR